MNGHISVPAGYSGIGPFPGNYLNQDNYEWLARILVFLVFIIFSQAKKIIVVTPKQRYYYYTLDEHINFFPQKELLTSLMDMPTYTCENIDGDWIYIGYLLNQSPVHG